MPFTVSVSGRPRPSRPGRRRQLLAMPTPWLPARHVSAELRAAGFTLPPSQANFVWLLLGSRKASWSRPPIHRGPARHAARMAFGCRRHQRRTTRSAVRPPLAERPAWPVKFRRPRSRRAIWRVAAVNAIALQRPPSSARRRFIRKPKPHYVLSDDFRASSQDVFGQRIGSLQRTPGGDRVIPGVHQKFDREKTETTALADIEPGPSDTSPSDVVPGVRG